MVPHAPRPPPGVAGGGGGDAVEHQRAPRNGRSVRAARARVGVPIENSQAGRGGPLSRNNATINLINQPTGEQTISNPFYPFFVPVFHENSLNVSLARVGITYDSCSLVVALRNDTVTSSVPILTCIPHQLLITNAEYSANTDLHTVPILTTFHNANTDCIPFGVSLARGSVGVRRQTSPAPSQRRQGKRRQA